MTEKGFFLIRSKPKFYQFDETKEVKITLGLFVKMQYKIHLRFAAEKKYENDFRVGCKHLRFFFGCTLMYAVYCTKVYCTTYSLFNNGYKLLPWFLFNN